MNLKGEDHDCAIMEDVIRLTGKSLARRAVNLKTKYRTLNILKARGDSYYDPYCSVSAVSFRGVDFDGYAVVRNATSNIWRACNETHIACLTAEAHRME